MKPSTGTLFVVATPIGNLDDITLRALRILRDEVSLIACEDTRQTHKLLSHFNIDRPVTSYHDHNEASRTEDLVNRLQQGDNIALVSDAGTPLLSDPGYRLVARAAEVGIPVVPIPGASAALAALAAAGLSTDTFYFRGFLPPKSSQRQSALEQLSEIDSTVILYEAPHRVLECLEDIAAIFPNRHVVAGRELTKLHEEFLRGTAAEIHAILAARPSIKGEFTILLGKPDRTTAPELRGNIAEKVAKLIEAGLPRMQAIKEVARQLGIPKRDVYREVEEEEQ